MNPAVISRFADNVTIRNCNFKNCGSDSDSCISVDPELPHHNYNAEYVNFKCEGNMFGDVKWYPIVDHCEDNENKNYFLLKDNEMKGNKYNPNYMYHIWDLYELAVTDVVYEELTTIDRNKVREMPYEEKRKWIDQNVAEVDQRVSLFNQYNRSIVFVSIIIAMCLIIWF